MVRVASLLLVLALVAGCGGEDSDEPARGGEIVWAVGDAADPGPDGEAVAATVKAEPFDKLLYVGDVYETGTLREFEEHYDPLYGDVADRTAPIMGNHEYRRRRRGYDVYWRRKIGRVPRRWYAFTVGGWEFLALSTLGGDQFAGSRQLAWLRRHLADGPATTCRIAFWHRPRYSAGVVHGDEPRVQPLWDAIAGKAVAVVSGDDHNLQRLQPVDGVTQFVAGAGGRRPPRAPPRPPPGLRRRRAPRRAALRAVARQRRVHFVGADGAELDRGELPCDR